MPARTKQSQESQEPQVTMNAPIQANLNPAVPQHLLEFMRQPKFEGTIKSFPQAQLLNDKSHAGLFLKQEEMAKAGWLAIDTEGMSLEVCGEFYAHTYNDGNIKSGLFFKRPALHIISQSPRFIEVTQNGTEAGLGKSGTILGIYADEEGTVDPAKALWYDANKGNVSLRTFYLIQLVDEGGTAMHTVPFCLSVKGTAASALGKAIAAMESAYYGLVGVPCNADARSLLIFQPTLVMSMEGDTRKSPCCIVATNPDTGNPVFEWRFASSDVDNLSALDEQFSAIRKANDNFSYRFMKEVADTIGVHQLSAGMEQVAAQYLLPDSDADPDAF